jgi:SAM-dependent methyltransferase
MDEYATEAYRWWHLSEPSPELHLAIDEKWITSPGRVLDLGCGLGTELGFLAQLAQRGFVSVGVDLSAVALSRAADHYPDVSFVRADVLNLPFASEEFDVLLDRGCFHYMPAQSRARYEQEARRMLRPGGRLLLRACLRSEGIRNDLDEDMLRQTFAHWRVVQITHAEIPSDTRRLEALVVRLERL